MFTLLPSSENSWNGERDLPPPTLRGLGAGEGCARGPPPRPALPGAGSPPLPPCRGRPAAPRVRTGGLCPALGAGGKRNSEGVSGESGGGSAPRPQKSRAQSAHTGHARRTVCGDGYSQVSEGRVGTILVSSPSLTPLLSGAHVPRSGRRVFPGGPDHALLEARGSRSPPRGLY